MRYAPPAMTGSSRLAFVLPLLSALALGLPAPAPGLPDVPARLEAYLPAGTDYDPAVPTPASVLGWEPGEWHVRHDQLVAYMEALAAASDRVRIERTGSTHEDRPLLLLTISSPQNLARLESIRERHVALSEPDGTKPDTAQMPVVVYLGYSVHGNEASGANAALVVAYHLAAARGGEVARWLENAVILLDPSLNPDGLARFAQWANMHRGRVLVADPEHREHVEGWPSGRTNHYWFDLNRDWLPAVHPESRARLATFHRWRPNLLTDFHEMGSDSTFFFQPGVPSRQNPHTPKRATELTGEIAEYHARALDAIGSQYFTEEVFDDFYYGKGSTYPDVNGAIGILFEQASARGHLRETVNGELSFPFAIRNQVTTSFSSLAAAVDKRRELLDWQVEFTRDAMEEAGDDPRAGWVFGDPFDPARGRRLAELLERHRIHVHRLARPLEVDGTRWEPQWAWAVPLAQPQTRLARALFERPTEFADTTFYDVSAWTLPLAYGLPYVELGGRELPSDALGPEVGEIAPPAGRLVTGDRPAVAWAMGWESEAAPRALARLLGAGLRIRVASEPTTVSTAEGDLELGYGALVVPAGIQTMGATEVAELLASVAADEGVEIFAVPTGLTPRGIDLGSPSLLPLTPPRPLLVVGPGVSSSAAGEIWHLLDHEVGLAVSLVERDRLGRIDLDAYTHVILVDGSWGDLGEAGTAALDRWVEQGGILVTERGAALWADGRLRGEEGSAAPEGAEAAGEASEQRRYVDRRRDRDAERISGAIFEVELDLTHPLAWGYRRARLPVFRIGEDVLFPNADNPYGTVGRYTAQPLLAGYVSADNQAKIAGSAAVLSDRRGRGAVVRFLDPVDFRGFWHGTRRLLLNALFFGDAIEETVIRGAS